MKFLELFSRITYDEQLLVAVGLGSGGKAQVRALAQVQLAMPIDGDVAYL
jgi:hypothetical protein